MCFLLFLNKKNKEILLKQVVVNLVHCRDIDFFYLHKM